MIKTILHANDLSEGSNGALKTSIFLANNFQAELHLLHVIEEIKPEMLKSLSFKEDITSFVDKLKEDRKETARSLLKDAKVDDLPVKVHLAVGRVFTEIIKTGEEIDANLIILGTHARTGMDAFFIGSNAWRVISEKKFPILTTRKPIFSAPRTILIPLDLSDLSLISLKYARFFGEYFNSRIVIVHILEILESMAKWEAMDIIEKRVSNEIYSQHIGEGQGNYKVRVEKATDAKSGILDIALQENAELVIMTTHGRGGLEKRIFGSVTERIIRECPCPVISIPPIFP